MKKKPQVEETMKKRSYQKVLMIPDMHVPFHDKKWLDSLLQFAEINKPDTVFIMGDLVDFYAISRFVKNPLRALKLQEEINVARNVLKRIKATCPTSKIVFIRGNHEARLQKYLWSTAQELSGLDCLNVPELLGLKELGMIYAEKGRYNFCGEVIKHGSVVRKFSAYTAKAETEKHGKSGTSGHTHRAGVYFQSDDSGDISWIETGCGCRLDQEYMEGEKPNWQQGWGWEITVNSKIVEKYFIRYKNGKAFFMGRQY